MLKEPESMTIPSEEDFYYDGDVDERWALRHYLGKDVEVAEKRYYTLDPLSILHDFTLVGCRAFRYYIFGAFRYLQSNHSQGEPDVYSALPEILDNKLSEDPGAFLPIAAYIVEFSQWAIWCSVGVDGYRRLLWACLDRYAIGRRHPDHASTRPYGGGFARPIDVLIRAAAVPYAIFPAFYCSLLAVGQVFTTIDEVQ